MIANLNQLTVKIRNKIWIMSSFNIRMWFFLARLLKKKLEKLPSGWRFREVANVCPGCKRQTTLIYTTNNKYWRSDIILNCYSSCYVKCSCQLSHMNVCTVLTLQMAPFHPQYHGSNWLKVLLPGIKMFLCLFKSLVTRGDTVPLSIFICLENIENILLPYLPSNYQVPQKLSDIIKWDCDIFS